MFVVAPAFNLDLSKVEIRDDEIVIKKEKLENQSNSTPYRSIWEYGMDFVNTKDGETMHVTPEMVRQIFEAIKEDNGRNYVASYTSRKFTREQYIAVCDEVENLLANDSGDAEYRACEHVLGEGFDKTETWIIKVCLLQTMNRVPWNILKHFHPNRKHGIELNHLPLQTRMTRKLRKSDITRTLAKLW